MKLAHLSDLHLGFRQFARANPAGANQREFDVAEALHRAIDGVIAARPDAVLIAGDVFHSIRPTNPAIITLFADLQRLRAALPSARVVAIAGDHDSPRSSETGFILPLYRALGVDMALSAPARFPLADGWTVTAVPVFAVPQLGAEVKPEGARDILLTHGEFRGFRQRETGGASTRIVQERLDGWAYVALGHYHVCTQVGARAWYAGSIEYASSDPWGEVREERKRGLSGKGWLLVTLEDGREPAVEFQPIATRRVLDLAPLDANGLAAAEIDAAITARFGPDLDGAVARLVVTNISRPTQHALDFAAIRALKARALQLRIDYRRLAAADARVESGHVRMGQLDAIVDEFLSVRALPGDVDRAELRRLGGAYLAAAAGAEDPYDTNQGAA